jgi:hypothetical protein
MTESELNSRDKIRLRKDIKVSMVFGLLFSIALVILVGLIPGILFIFGKRPSDGFIIRCLIIIGLLFIPFIIISYTNILKYFDLKKGKKLIIKTDNFEIVNKKDSAYILTRDNNKQKIKIDSKLVPLLKLSQPLKMEISVLAKSLLFISQGNGNLLEKLNGDEY